MDKNALKILDERFGHDTNLSVATMDGDKISVRIVNSYYADGSFYIITYALSNKIKQIEKNPTVGVCGEWFSAHGIGINSGWVKDEKNKNNMATLRNVFSQWYSNGHTNEDDTNTCLLQIKLTDAVLFSHGTRYDLDFTDNISNK